MKLPPEDIVLMVMHSLGLINSERSLTAKELAIYVKIPEIQSILKNLDILGYVKSVTLHGENTLLFIFLRYFKGMLYCFLDEENTASHILWNRRYCKLCPFTRRS